MKFTDLFAGPVLLIPIGLTTFIRILMIPKRGFFLHYGDISDSGQITNLIYNIQPDEIYHLAAQSHVRVSFDMPEFTGDISGLGTTRLLESS